MCLSLSPTSLAGSIGVYKDVYIYIYTSPWATYPFNGMVLPLPRIICILGMMLAMLGRLSSTV